MEMTLTARQINCCEQLARFFPEIASVRVPIRVTALRNGSSQLQEVTLLEFSKGEIAIFLSSLPLEFDDRVRMESRGKERTAEATVVALQYHDGSKAVAVKFLQGPCDWILQP